MTQVVSFLEFVPIPRYDSVPWSTVRIEEGTTSAGPWVQIDELALSPLDVDPENPASRNFTTDEAADTVGLWYRVVFVDAATDTEAPTDPIQNGGDSTAAYADVTELARILRVDAVTRSAALQRVLLAAAGEIDAEVGRGSADALAGWELALAAEVNLERAVEHWQQMQSPFGIVGLGADTLPTITGRDSWERHAMKLSPLKQSWGIA